MFHTVRKPILQREVTLPKITSSQLDKTVCITETSKAGRTAAQSHCAVHALTAKSNVFSLGGRDTRVDTLRGLFLIVMMVDHLPYHPLHRFSRQGFGFVSAAEGFVFVSGLVSAWVYGRILNKQGEAALRRRAWHRARDIYLIHLFLYSVALLGGLWGGWQIASQFADFWGAWWHGAVLIYQPRLFGILPMYAVFMLLLPLLLQQMAKGRAVLIWAASITLWLAAQLGVGSSANNPAWLQLGFFNILAWQLLFVAGAYFGYRKAAERPSPIQASRGLFLFSVFLATLLFLVRHQTFFFGHFSPVDTENALGAWRSVNHPMRLINFAALAYILWYLPRSVDAKVRGLPAFRLLRYLGGHSLQVFAWSILVSYVAFSFKDSWISLSPAWQILLAVTAALSLALPAWVHEQWRFMAQHRAAYLPGTNVFMPQGSSASAEK
jgi:hypothetical protein